MTNRLKITAVAALSLLGSATAATIAVAANGAEAGRMVFYSQGCYGCHRIGIAGTPIANDLSHVGSKYTEGQLAQWLRDPKLSKPSAHMPRLALEEDEIRALAAYLATLR